jgi:predicted RNA methylase
MKTATVSVPPEVKAVLAQVTYVGNDLLKLPPELPRQLYVSTDKVLKAMGGKWDKRRDGHVFPGDPRPKVREALGGELVDEKKTRQAFYTPADVAGKLVDHVQHTAKRFLEPSAGNGALILATLDRFPFAEFVAVEIDPKACGVLKQIDAVERVVNIDFLECTPEKGRAVYQLGTFDVVIANPPFTDGQDVEHVMKMWDFVAPGGRLIAIVSPGFKFRQGARWDIFRNFHERYAAETEELPEGAFSEAGTNVRTVLIVWHKP